MSFGGHLIIGESSDTGHIEKSKALLEEMKIGYKLTHLHVPKNPGETISQSMNACFKKGIACIDTDYAMLSCDDDIPVPETLERCESFLDQNPTYNGANGELSWYDISGVAKRWYGLRKLALKTLATFLDVTNLQGQRYGINDAFDLKSDTAVERMKEFLLSPFHTMFVVVRKETLKYIIPERADEIQFPHFVADYSWMIAIAMAGKIKHFNVPQVIRQYHGKNLSIRNENHPFPTYLESMLEPTWGNDSKLWVEYLGNLIQLYDKVDRKYAEEQAMEAYRMFSIFRLGGTFSKKKKRKISKLYFFTYCLPWTEQRKKYSKAVAQITQVPLEN